MKMKLLVILAGAVVALAPALAAPSLDKVIDTMADHLEAIQTLDQEGHIIMEFEVDGYRETTRMPFSFLYEKPGRLQMSNEFLLAVSRTNTLWMRGVKPGRYAEMDLGPDGLRALESMQPMLWRSLLPDKRALLSAQPRAALKDYFQRNEAQTLEDELVGDRTNHVVVLIARDLYWLKAARAKIWIDALSGLIRRIESGDATSEASSSTESNGPARFRPAGFRYEVDRSTINEPISDERMTFVVGDNDRKAEGIGELFGTDEADAVPPDSEAARTAPDLTLYRTLMNTNYFVLSWTTPGETVASTWRDGRQAVLYRIPSRTLLIPGTGGLVLVEPEQGLRTGVVAPPPAAAAKNEQEEPPRYCFLRTTNDGVVVSVQTRFNKVERESGINFYPTESVLYGFDRDGRTLWTLTLGRPFLIDTLGAVPLPGGSDALLVATWDGFSLIAAEGKVLLHQKVGFAESVEIADRDADGIAEFYVIGAQPARYDWRRP